MMMEHPDADELIEAYKYQCDDWIKEYNKRKKKSFFLLFFKIFLSF